MSGINKPTENWSKFPNCILDNLDKYTPAEFKVLLLMVKSRETTANLSVKYICNKCNLSKGTVIKAIKGLTHKDQIKKVGEGERGLNLYDIVCMPSSYMNIEKKDYDSMIDNDRLFTGVLRTLILNRDKYTCRECGDEPFNKSELDIHHIIPYSDGGKTNYGNGITLCKKCHKEKHRSNNNG